MITRIANTLLKRARTIIFAGACLVGLGVLMTNSGKKFELQMNHIHDTVLPKRASQKIVVVAMDPKSMSAMPAWPWPRSVHGKLVEQLSESGASQVVFDVNFTRPASEPVQDKQFAQSIRKAQIPVSMIGTTETPEGNKFDALPNKTLLPYVNPVSGWISVGEKTGTVSVPYEQNIAGKYRKSMSTVLAKHSGTALKNLSIDWSIQSDSIPVYSYSDVLNGRFPAGTFANKNVIVGATAQTFGDHWTVPSGDRIPGVYIHAIAAETLMRAQPVPVGALPLFALAVLIVGAGLLTGSRVAAASISLLGVPVVVVAQWVAEAETAYLMHIAPALVTLFTAMFLATTILIIGRLMRAFTTDRGTSLPNFLAMQIEEPAGNTTIAVRLRNHIETSAVLGTEAQAELMRRVRDRIRLASGDNVVYQVDEQSFAWRTNANSSGVIDTMEGLITIFSGGIQISGRTVDTPVSAGIVEDGEMPIDRAVASAVLAAEHAGRHDLPWTRHQDVANDAEWRMTVVGEIDEAIKKDQLWVAYQPKHDLRTSQNTGAEALIRWTHPERGPIRPDQFIPILEDAGRIESLTSFVLRNAIRDFADFDGLSVAVNISTRMLGRDVIRKTVAEALAEYGLAPELLTLEVTESAEIASDQSVVELEELRAMGVKISIDDYGTGQSTLNYLRKLPAHELKIDQSFVRNMDKNKSDQAMISSTIALAHQLGLSVVAEGVETLEIMDALRALECDIIQGYYIGKPMPLSDFIKEVVVGHVLQRKAS